MAQLDSSVLNVEDLEEMRIIRLGKRLKARESTSRGPSRLH
jgi:hypothetical protein